MGSIENIYEAITADGFCERTLQFIDEQVNDIQNGTEDFPRFNLSEHAGVCTGGAALIGASVVACYARASLEASANAGAGQDGGPSSTTLPTALPLKTCTRQMFSLMS